MLYQKAGIRGRDKKLYLTDIVRCNYLPLPFIHALYTLFICEHGVKGKVNQNYVGGMGK